MLSFLRRRNAPPPKAAERDHPPGPAMHPVRGPKNYFEYFVNEDNPDHVWFEARFYFHVKQADGTWKRDVRVIQSPAKTATIARHAAQQWGHKQMEELK